METSNRAKQLKPYHGITIFILVLLMLIFVAAPIQEKLGIYGVAVTEVIILLLAVIPAILLKTGLREVFPIKKPAFRQIIGTLIIWIGSFLAVTLVTLITGYLFPDGLGKVSSALRGVFTSVPMGIAFLIIAVMPAVCEEALHRGIILASFNCLKNRWIKILCMGIIFGIFHLDPFRFLPTAILGMAITYIMIQTQNILLPIFLHLVNNSLSTFTSFVNEPRAAVPSASMSIPLVAIGSYFIIGAAIPFLLLLGARLINGVQLAENEEAQLIEKKRKRKRIVSAVLCSAIMLAAGAATMGFSMSAAPVFEISMGGEVNCDSEDLQFPMKIEKSGVYMMDLELSTGIGLVEMSILDEGGGEVFNTSCGWCTSNNLLELKEGTYQVVLKFHIEDIEEYCKQVGMTYDEETREELNVTGDLYEYSPYELKMTIRKL